MTSVLDYRINLHIFLVIGFKRRSGMMNFEIPAGLTDLLQDFTVAVLKERPPNLTQFAADYFVKLNEQKQKDNVDDEKPRGVRFVGSPPACRTNADGQR